jgi:hypothetical protein
MDYNSAQICLNGHVVNAFAIQRSESNQDFCATCGAKTIMKCPKCDGLIRGCAWGAWDSDDYRRPANCIKCGSPLPWTEAQSQAAIDLFIEESGFTGDDAKGFEDAVHDAVKDGPRTQVAGSRIGKALKKVSKQTGKVFYDVVKDILSEAAKKAIWPNQPPH